MELFRPEKYFSFEEQICLDHYLADRGTLSDKKTLVEQIKISIGIAGDDEDSIDMKYMLYGLLNKMQKLTEKEWKAVRLHFPYTVPDLDEATGENGIAPAENL